MAEYKMFWNTSMENDFIDLIHEKRLIWDKKDELYTRKSIKRQEFENIVGKLREKYPFHFDLFTYELLMKKFNGYKNRFKVELSKIKDLKSKRPDMDNIPRWQFFDRLHFLMNNCTDEESGSNPNDCNISQNWDASNEEHDYSIAAFQSAVFPEISVMGEIEGGDDIYLPDPQSSQRDPQSSQRDPQSSQRDPQSSQRDPQSSQRDSQSSQRDSQSSQHDPQSSQRMTDAEIQEGTNHISKKRKHEHCSSCEATDIDETFAHYIAMSLKEIKDPCTRDRAKIEVQKVLFKHKFGRNAD